MRMYVDNGPMKTNPDHIEIIFCLYVVIQTLPEKSDFETLHTNSQQKVIYTHYIGEYFLYRSPVFTCKLHLRTCKSFTEMLSCVMEVPTSEFKM